MVNSMTGFGRCETSINGRDVLIEIKSVNHRYYDFSCRVTRGYNFLEEKLKKYIGEKVSRGKVDVFLSVSAPEDTEVEVKVNHGLASGYVKALQELNSTYNLVDDISATTISRYNDVLTINKAPEDEEEVWNDIVTPLNTALDSFLNMRKAEGNKLKEDIEERANKILDYVTEIEKESPNTTKRYEERLKEKIEETLEKYNNNNYDEQRILTEVAIFADKVAVSEETVRLKSHFEQFTNIINTKNGPIGRSLDFIIQEMNREANTIGSKVLDVDLAHIVVDIKSEIEKIREQVQNIE